MASEVPLAVFISIAATYNYVKPDTMYPQKSIGYLLFLIPQSYWHHSGTCNFTGYWWDRIKAMVTLNVYPIPATVCPSPPIVQG